MSRDTDRIARDMDRIARDVCDVCGRRRKGVLFHHFGVPVLFGCRVCQPKNYRKLLRATSRLGEGRDA